MPADIPQRSIWRRALDAIFGYDFFISYSWVDGGAYATALMRRLEAQGFQVFLDRNDYASGDDWKQVGAWTLRRTGQLILVGTAGALTSPPVARELDIFAATGRRIVPIDFGGSLDRLAENVPARRHLQDQILRIRELPAALTAGPSDEAVATIRRTFTLVRQDRKRLMIAGTVACVMTVLALASTLLAGYAQVQKTAAFESARQTFVRQADLSASIAFRLFSEGRPVLGFKVAREGAPSAIAYGTPLTARLALALSRGWSQIQEEADLRHPDGNITNAIWSPDGSRAVTATLTDPPRVWNAGTGQLEAILGSGIQPDYVILRDPSELSFSLDGKRLATQLGDAATVWDTTSWTSLLTTACESTGGRLVRLAGDGKTVAAQCHDGMHVWDVATKRELYHQSDLPNSEGLTAFAFADGGDTFVHLDEKKTGVGILRHIASGTPEVVPLPQITAALQGSSPDQGIDSIHPTRVPGEVIILGPKAIFRVDIARDRVIWQTAFSADDRNWFQLLPAIDAIATASVLDNGDLEYQVARGPHGPLLYGGLIHLSGDHARSTINAVTFQDDGKGMALALNTGVQVSVLGKLVVKPRGIVPEKPEAQNTVVYSAACSWAETEAKKIALVADGSRMIATCGDGNAHAVRLREAPVARLAGMQSTALFGNAMVRLAGTGPDTRLEIVNASGATTGQSDKIGESVSYWLANEAGSNVLLVSASGTVRSWRAGTPGFAAYDIRLAGIRAARFAPDGARAALLDQNGAFVRIRLGETTAESVGRVGAVMPAIDYAIDPTLSALAFTTKDLAVSDPAVKPPAAVDDKLAIVAIPGKDGAQFSCRRSETMTYSAALFSEAARAPVVYLVKRDRSVEKLAAKAGGANGLMPCPAGVPDAFNGGLKWQINSFTHESVRIVEASDQRPARLIFSAAADTPLELIDLASNHSITDLTSRAGGTHPLAVSPGGRVLAATGDDDRTVEVFDVATGNLLRRLRTEQAVVNDRAGLLFAPGDQSLLVRLTDGSTVTYPLTLLEGTDLLEHIRALGLAPLTDDETREIYDIRQRLSRPPAFGALSLPPHENT
jgi:WD40 repeat protein